MAAINKEENEKYQEMCRNIHTNVLGAIEKLAPKYGENEKFSGCIPIVLSQIIGCFLRDGKIEDLLFIYKLIEKRIEEAKAEDRKNNLIEDGEEQ